MTREQAINSMISHGFTVEQTGEIIKAVTDKPTTKIEESNFSQEQYLADLQSAYDCGKSIIDKIRAEILKISSYKGFELGGFKDGYSIAMVNVLKILDKYKAESKEI